MGDDEGYLDEEDDRVRLIKVVEYLEPIMAKELLSKFPDNSAFDFDYAQSSIWSPVAPRAFKSIPAPEIQRLLEFDSDDVTTPRSPKGKQQLFCGYRANKSAVKGASRIMKSRAMNLNLVLVCNIRKKVFKCGHSVPSPVSVKHRATTGKSSKGWDVVLKAASKHFKKRKKKDEIVHVKISEYIIKNGIF